MILSAKEFKQDQVSCRAYSDRHIIYLILISEDGHHITQCDCGLPFNLLYLSAWVRIRLAQDSFFCVCLFCLFFHYTDFNKKYFHPNVNRN